MTWENFFQQICSNTDTVILTPNRRLTTYLKKQYYLYQRQLGLEVWPALKLLPYGSWLEALWHQQQLVNNSKLLLNSIQQQWLWEKAIQQSKYATNLLQIVSTAKLTQKAWQLISEWDIPLYLDDYQQQIDSQFFYETLINYLQQLEKLNATDQASLPSLLQELIRNNKVQLPNHIYLFGFDELTPMQLKLLECCREQQSIYKQLDVITTNQTQYQISADNLESELTLMARFAKAQNALDPELQIGCVVPNLTEIRDCVSSIFAKVFADNPDCYAISAGKNLYDFPIIYAAINIIRLNENVIPTELISFLLHTPFCKYFWRESNSRALLDKKIKKLGLFTLTKKHFLELLTHYCPLLAKQMHLFWITSVPEKQSFNEWSNYFLSQLVLFGWPGDREINSEEYQLINKFQESLCEYASLDRVTNSVSFKKAFEKFTQLLQNTLFQKQSSENTISVLGSLEAAGILFDKLWIMGMDDRQFPQVAKPNPFIPLSLQKKYKVPHATAERELIFSTQLLQRFQVSAKHIIYSYAKQNADSELLPSRLLNPVESINQASLVLADYRDIKEIIFDQRNLELFIDNNAPIVSKEELEHLYGGTSIFKHQAACPFRAFAKTRLNSIGTEEPAIGLSALDRGAILHKCLEIIWKKLKSQQQLLALLENELTIIITTAIEQALAELKPKLESEKPRFYAIEITRLQTVLMEWLTLEKKRPPFSVIETEAEKKLTYANIPLKMRIDRMDISEHGQHILIDYKTGSASVLQWLGERMDEPQLPLYCLSDDKKIDAIGFAQLRANEYCFKGLSAYTTEINGIKAIQGISWDEQIQIWQKQLTRLANDFLQGVATVDPKDKKACEHCDLQIFCRVYEKL